MLSSSDELQFLNIFSANKVAILCLLNFIAETTRVTEGRMLFRVVTLSVPQYIRT